MSIHRLAVLLLLASACQHAPPPTPPPAPTAIAYAPDRPAPPIALVHAKLWTGEGRTIDDGTIVLRDGRIEALGGPETRVGDGVQVVDAKGRWVTPGIIDVHSHLGVYPTPRMQAHMDGNEMTSPVTAEVRAQDSFWPLDPGLLRAAQGGVTSLLVLPGSGNLIGGLGFVIKNRPARSAAAMRFPGARPMLKMACGENPKRVYGMEKKTAPMTRMGNVAGDRAAFAQARDYELKWREWEKGEKDKGKPPPARDLKLETLASVMRGDIWVQNHCYRADEMLAMLDVATEFGFTIRAFHHALEAYKIRDVLAARGVAVATWADWWGFKMEAYDGIPENLVLVHEAGARAVVHSDSDIGTQRLNQEAGKALAAGREMGLRATEDDALRWVTANPAWVLGVDDQVGTLAPGKMADVVLWSAHPLSVYALADLVIVDGNVVVDRGRPAPASDFELGLVPSDAEGGR